jgi:hypothetical protein
VAAIVTEDRPKRLFMKDFKPEEFEFKPFDFRFSFFSLMYPYEAWEFFGRNGGFPAPMRKRNPFTPEYFYWIAKWVIIGAVPVLLVFAYGLIASIVMQDELSAVMKALGGVVFCGYGIWLSYNLRRGYRAGVIAKANEGSQGTGKIS